MTLTGPETTHSPALSTVPALDGLRGLAVAGVVLTHGAFMTGFGASGGLVGRLFARGDYGVSLFFALSGFLLYRGLTVTAARTGRLDLRGYAARRAARVLPAYWLTLAVVVLIVDPEPRSSVLNALGIQIYVPDGAIPAFGQAWSIATELSFYAALPFVVMLLGWLRRRRPNGPMAVLATALVVMSLIPLLTGPASYGEDLLLERWLPWRAPHFLIGMVCAEALAVPHHPLAAALARRARDRVGCTAVAAASYLAATTPLAGPLDLQPAYGFTLLMRVLCATVMAGALLVPVVLAPPSSPTHPLAHPVARWLGSISYGVFLWHLPVFTALFALSGVAYFRGGLSPLLAIGVPITLFLGFLSLHLVELPASRGVARLLARRRQGGHRHHGDDRQPDAALQPGRAE
ncbi:MULTISPECIES: acyltransferase family protein [unclassified Janibacter]|uniref:acyltransferase family protein n=1 Tax=unclassified Janibacter TaxID=2649294 RepID=UPI003D00BAD5